ncbi:hypothetical protein Bca4012_083313 [Brassica carinata]
MKSIDPLDWPKQIYIIQGKGRGKPGYDDQKASSGYVHSKGLKLGIYPDAEYMYIHNCHSLLWKGS